MSDFDKPLERTGRSRMHLRRKKDSDAFGRFAESTARFMGSPKFILYMTVFVLTWVVANVLLVKASRGYAWDPYPFILLNLAFSTQASYSAPLILLAQNRQDDRDRVIAEQDSGPSATWPTPNTSPGRSPACAWGSERSPRATSSARSSGWRWRSTTATARSG